MDDQLEAIRQDIRSVKDKIVKIEQDLAIAKQSGNKGGEEEVRFLRGRLEKLDSQLLSLQEKENILLRVKHQASVALSLYVLTKLCFHHIFPLYSVNDSILWVLLLHTVQKGCLPGLI